MIFCFDTDMTPQPAAPARAKIGEFDCTVNLIGESNAFSLRHDFSITPTFSMFKNVRSCFSKSGVRKHCEYNKSVQPYGMSYESYRMLIANFLNRLAATIPYYISYRQGDPQ